MKLLLLILRIKGSAETLPRRILTGLNPFSIRRRFLRLVAQICNLPVSAGFVIMLTSIRVLAENTNNMVKPPVALPGGLGIHPVITSVTHTQDIVTVEWFGIQGPFQLLRAATADSQDWQSLAGPTFASKQSAPLQGDLGFFRVLGGRPVSSGELGGTVNYVGAVACIECHAETHHTWGETAHAKAFETVGSSRVDLQACKLEYSIVSPK